MITPTKLYALLALASTSLLPISTASAQSMISAPSIPATTHTISITYENLTSGQIFSPSAFASHNNLAAPFFTIGKPAPFGLQRMAEEGNNGPTFSGVVIPNLGKLFLSASTALSALPGQKRTVTVKVTPEFPLISAYWMLVRTNDGFTGISGLNGYALGGTKTIYLYAYDAGTEKNNEQSPFLVALDGSMRDPEGGVVLRHPGLRTNATDPTSDIPGDWYFNPARPVAKVTFTRLK